MVLKKTLLITLLVIFSDLKKAGGKGHSHGHSSGGSHRGSSSSLSSGYISSHSHHTSNSASRSSTPRKLWSSYSSDELMTSDIGKPITLKPPVYDSFKYSPPEYNFNEDYKPVTYGNRAPAQYMPQSLSIAKLDDYITGYITGKVDSTVTDFSHKSPLDNDNAYLNYHYSEPYQPPIIVPPSLENSIKEKSNSKEDILSTKHSANQLNPLANTLESLNLNIPLPGITNSLSVHCQQHLHSEFNERGEIVDSVKKICNPLKVVTTTAQPITSTSTTTTSATTLETTPPPTLKPFAVKEKRYERIRAPTPRGINCRKVMNSEFNERGEIVDSVIEVCDPLTTTTTTTRKPTLKTTTRRPTITRKPLIKVCRRVMDCYLNEAGEIIDSVTEVCTMEPQK